jgi:hypothetical protein
MSSDPKLSEWNLLQDQFQALVREGSDSIEDIFDVQFSSSLQQIYRSSGRGRLAAVGQQRTVKAADVSNDLPREPRHNMQPIYCENRNGSNFAGVAFRAAPSGILWTWPLDKRRGS